MARGFRALIGIFAAHWTIRLFALLCAVGGLTNCSLNLSLNPSLKSTDAQVRSQGNDTNHIVNGELVTDGDAIKTSTVGLFMKLGDGTKAADCSGTLIAPNLVLTAAHCLMDEPTNLVVIFGKDMYEALANANENRPVDLVVQNPHWVSGLNMNEEEHRGLADGDLAILRFQGDLPVGYAPAHLVPPTYQPSVDDPIYVAGYGSTDGDAPPDNDGGEILRKTTMTFERLDPNTPDQADSDGRKTGTCVGDSGGPAYTKQDGRYLLWGVLQGGLSGEKAGEKCKSDNYHTLIVPYLDWIYRTMSRLNLMAKPNQLTFVESN